MSKTLQEILEENSIQTFESSNGRRVANCPFHEGDRHPSFTIYPNETYFCFGCKVWGDAVKFLIDFKHMPAAEAMAYVGVDYRLPREEKRVIKVKNILKTSIFLYEVALKYHQNVLMNPGPMKYLEDRGLSIYTIVNHMVGYTDGSILDFKFAEEYEMANEVGLLNKSGYETMAHRITIPNLIDHKLVDFMTGRTVINEKPKYLGLRMPKPIMGFHQYRHSPILFVVEGQFDWLLLKQWGYPAVVLSGSHITRTNAQSLMGKFLVYIPDNDQVGKAAAQSMVDRFGPLNTCIIDISKSGYKDISEWNQFNPLAREQFRELVSQKLSDISLSHPSWEKYLPDLIMPKPLALI